MHINHVHCFVSRVSRTPSQRMPWQRILSRAQGTPSPPSPTLAGHEPGCLAAHLAISRNANSEPSLPRARVHAEMVAKRLCARKQDGIMPFLAHGQRLVACLAKTVERAWVRVAKASVGPDGQVVPKQCVRHATSHQVDLAGAGRTC